ncbi:hypothetical protein Prudu_021599 [Prunus dulcis]|uniref:Transposase MuDR plant domain-containing protein n=1 Tax=Prunus dulcis TaxID=3755 RepID=A0A4Y1RYV6_PRUDU|nr:hypothetical protein Prudu_021599 [Prunus dulcis]
MDLDLQISLKVITLLDDIRYETTLDNQVSISSNECKHTKIEDNDDVKFFIKYICDVIPSKVAPLLVSIEDRGVTNVVGDRMHNTTDMNQMACSSNAIVESNGDVHGDFGTEYLDMIDFTGVEGVHSGDHGTEMNGLQMPLAPPILANLETFSQVGVVGFGTASELSIRHNWRQMGEQNVNNLGIVNDEEEDIENTYSRNNWDPKLEVGKIFCNKEALSNKLQLAAVRGHFEFKVKQSCKSRLVVVCSQGPCPWRLCASSHGEKNFMIVKYNPVDECDMSFIHDKHCHASAKLVGNAVKQKLKDSRTRFSSVTINYCKAWRLRELTLMSTRGSVEEAYSLLPAYCHELERVNSDTRTYIHTDENNHFFKLHGAIGECPNLVIISDRNISIENVWHNVFPTAQHGICFYHMKGNMKHTFTLKKSDKLLLYFEQAAKSYGIAKFDCHFGKIKGNDEVAQYLESAGLHKWSRAHMDGRRYNVMTTNIAESINSVLRFARMLPVVHLIDEIINLLVKWFSKRLDFDLKCTSTLCPDFGRRNNIYLVQPQELWIILEDVQSRVVRPPNAKVMPGRRKKLRILSQGEDILRRKCSRCSGTCHNKSTLGRIRGGYAILIPIPTFIHAIQT